ncbi:MAG: lytic murein transglycosylase B [Pseudomonadales bacterium]
MTAFSLFRGSRRWCFRLIILAALGQAALPALGSYTSRDDVRTWVATQVAEHDLDAAAVMATLDGARRQQSILDAIARPAERVLTWGEYRKLFVEPKRIEQGLEFWKEHATTLERARMRFGVPPEYVVAIIGVETRYGRITGSYRVLDALATLGFDYPPRATFFRSELLALLLLSREEGIDPSTLKGSYAGAMGYGQFIPSSFRAYAIDFDADGRRDIWGNPTDAIGSVANYFARHGWTREGLVAAPLGPASPAMAQRASEWTDESLELDFTAGALRAAGWGLPPIADDQASELLLLDGAGGKEVWAALPNFFVITRYNRSRLYALAVHELAGALRDRYSAPLSGAAVP